MDFRHVSDKKALSKYVVALSKLPQKSQDEIREEMRLFLSDHAKKERIAALVSGEPILPPQAEKPLKVKRRRPRRR